MCTNRRIFEVGYVPQLLSAIDGAVAEGELLIAVAGHVTAFGVHEKAAAPEIYE